MRSLWNRRPTRSPVSVGQFVANPDPLADDIALYRNGSYVYQPNSLVTPSVGSSAVQLDFGFGQALTLDFGGFRAVGPPPPESP